MRAALLAIAVLALPAAFAQDRSADRGSDDPAASAGQERLISPENLEPAVDTSRALRAPAASTDEGGTPAGGSVTAADVSPATRSTATAALSAGRRTATMDTLDLGTTSITGNQELPKVLYIVPWKSSDLGDLTGRPVNTLLEEVLAPVDPEVFERQLDFYESLYGTEIQGVNQ